MSQCRIIGGGLSRRVPCPEFRLVAATLALLSVSASPSPQPSSPPASSPPCEVLLVFHEESESLSPGLRSSPNHTVAFPIWHSNHTLGTFAWLLQKHEIEALVDVRRYPVSRRHPHFSRESLSASLEEEGVSYHRLEALGGNRQRSRDVPPSPNRGIEDEAFRNYANHTAKDDFCQGVKLLEIVPVHRTVSCAPKAINVCQQ